MRMAKVLTVTYGNNTIYAMQTSTTNFIGNDFYNHNCPRCNGFLNGNYLEYSRYMIRRYGLDKWEQLMDLFDQHKKGTAPKLSVIEKQTLYNSWLKKGRELEEKTSLKLFPKSWDYVNIK